MDEDKIRLLLELVGFSDVDEAINGLKHMKGAAVEATEGLEAVTPASEAAAAAARTLVDPYADLAKTLQQVEASSVSMTASQEAFAEAWDQIAAAQKAKRESVEAAAQADREAAEAAILVVGSVEHQEQQARQVADALWSMATATREATEASLAQARAAQAASAAGQQVKAEAYDLAAAETTVAVSTAQVATAMQRSDPILTRAEQEFEELLRTTIETTQAQKAMGQILDELKSKQSGVNAATAKTKLTLADFSQNLTALGYIVNDAASVQGDLSQRLNATSNNLPMLLAGFGGLGLALSGLVPILGIVIKNWDHIVAAFTGDTGIIKTTGSLEEMQATLKKVNDQLEAAAASRWNSLATVQEYNRLAAAQLDLERNISEEKEKQARAAKLAALRPASETEEAKAKAKALQASLGGDQAALVGVVQQGLGDAEINARLRERNQLTERFNELNAKARQGMAFDEFGTDIQKELDRLEPAIEKADAAMNQAIEDRRKKAADIVGKAMIEGDAAAFGQMQQAVNAAADRDLGNAQLGRFRREIGRATPEGRQQQAEVAAEADQALEDQFQEAMKERVDLIEMLNDQGKANQQTMERSAKEEQEIADNLAETRKFLDESREKFRADMERMRAQTEKSIDQWSKRTGRDGNADRMIENQTAAQIQAATGADEATSHNLAKRALELQSQGIGLQQGVQFAMAELMAAANGNAQQLAALRQQLAAMIADIRRLKNQAFNEPFWMPAMQAGWGN